MAGSHRTSVNSFGYFLESVEKQTAADAGSSSQLSGSASAADCDARISDDPQLKVLHALKSVGDAACALDLMRETKLAPTVLLKTIKEMEEFGLVRLEKVGVAEARPPMVHLTPCGRQALDVYKGA